MMGKYLHDLRTLPPDALLAWRQRGWDGVRVEIFSRTLDRVVRFGRRLVVEQELANFREVPPPEGVRIDPFMGDWSRLGEISTRRELDRFRHNAARGRTCLVAWRAGRPIGYTWISDTMEPATEFYRIPLPADSAYLWDLWVVPAERGSGVGSALVAARLRHARDRGFRSGWRVIAPGNRASLRTLEKTSGSGTKMLGELVYLKIGRRVMMRFRPTAHAA